MAAEAEVVELAHKEGALSSKIKRLIAMAVALKLDALTVSLLKQKRLWLKVPLRMKF